jgi:hypothetical protein
MSVFKPATEWIAPDTFPTELLVKSKEVAIDLETRDPNLMSMGPGYIRGDGEVVGVAVACDGLIFLKTKWLILLRKFVPVTTIKYFTTLLMMWVG